MLLVNVNTKQFIPSAGSNFIQPVESRDQIIYGTRREVRFQLYNTSGTVFALNESDTFCCAGDINFIHTDDLMFYSGHEMCRIIDAAQGIVGVIIDATSDSFADKATSQNTRMYVQLKRHVAGDTLGDTVLQDIVYAQPAVMTTEGAPASSDPEYMTAAATLALLRTAPDYQFSVDGETNWHDQQDIAADRFYRERRNGGEWGPAIELIEGKTGPTGAAAGFGTPTVTVETLPAGSDATASVTASGDDTAKVFNFNFGIPKGADGAGGKAGADGADGVSSYTYVAYASAASGTGFSLTPTDALKFRAEIHTTTAIETPDAEDFAGATWVKYIGDDGTGTGDMTKSVYDTNDDGIVDHAAVADAVGATAAAQVADAVGKAHTHANKATLDKFGEANGKPTFDGAEIGGGSGTVKSVNGQFPDESGNVTIETGGAVDESRLLPTGGRNGNLLEYQEGVDRGNDVNTKLLIQPATSDGQIIDSAYGNEAPVGISQGTSNSPVTVENGESLAFSGSSAYLTIAKEDAAKIITGTNEWCFDVLITPEWSSGSAGAFHLGGGNYSIYINPSTGNSWIWSLSESGTIGLFANETHLLTLEQWLDGSTWKLSWYCDGVPKRIESFQYPVPDKAIRIGRGNDNDGYFQGKMNNIRFRTVADHRGASFAMPPFPFLPPAGQPVWAEGIDRSRLLKVPTSADEGKLPVIRADKIPAVYHDTTLAAIVIEDGKVIDKISGKELTKVGSPQIIDGGIHSPTNSDYYMLELEGVEGLPVAVSFDYQGDESPDSSNIVTINGNCAYYSMNGVSFCRSQGGGNNIKIDNQPVGVSEAYRNYVMQVSSDNYESKTPPVAFIAGESKSPTYEGSFPSMSPLSSVKICGRFGKIRNILIGSAFPYTGNFTPRGDGVEGFGVPEKREPGWNYETLDEAANGRLLPANPANGDIPCFDATATIGGGNDETVKFLLQPATTDGELIDSAAGAVTPATITNHSLTVSESGEIEFSLSKYATVPASGILADVLRHDKPWVFDLLVYLDQTSSQSRFFGTESGGDFFCQWTGDYGFDFKYGDTWISTLTGNVGEWNLLTLEYYQKNGTWHVALYLQGVLCQDKEISTSFDPKTSELAIGRSTSGSYLCSGKIRAIRIREGALYNGQSFTPDEFPYQEPQTVGEWGKLNKSELALKSDVLPEWRQLSGSSTITLDRANGELQKVTLTQNCTLTAPTLDADHPTMLLQVTSASAVTVTVGETNIVTDHTGTFQVGWYWDGETTRRYPAVEVA